MLACSCRIWPQKYQSLGCVTCLTCRRSECGGRSRNMTKGPCLRPRISSRRRETQDYGSNSHVHAIFTHRFGYLNLVWDWGNCFGNVHAETCGEKRAFSFKGATGPTSSAVMTETDTAFVMTSWAKTYKYSPMPLEIFSQPLSAVVFLVLPL